MHLVSFLQYSLEEELYMLWANCVYLLLSKPKPFNSYSNLYTGKCLNIFL